jgi:hypothetical protein
MEGVNKQTWVSGGPPRENNHKGRFKTLKNEEMRSRSVRTYIGGHVPSGYCGR